ncbi:unnamed protein product [Cuscuta campestris]|uniref:Bet v I/Major latex protein domain-containing protein n=1 Tax=Cuscuta campestris TaxID=132261 RepID=A0A484NKA4_9ASTE|nr:unnamed protein product [Cuscuta campestris]
MGVTTYTDSVESPSAPARLFKALFVDSHNLFPKVVPALVKSVDIVEGDGSSAGTVKKINYVEGETEKYVKNRIDEIDGAKLVCKYTLIEGHELGEKLESVRYEVTLEGKGDGGSICKTKIEFHTKGDSTIGLDEFKQGKDKWMGLMNAVEKYLGDNPAIYAA